MTFITKDKDIIEPKIRRRSLRDVVTVCPICFYVSRNESSIFSPYFSCTNSECGWSGSIPIEVSNEDYDKHMQNQQS